MTNVTLEQTKPLLEDLQKDLEPDSSLVIVRDGEPVAQLTADAKAASATPTLGFWKGKLDNISDDEHLRDFAEYMG